LIFALLEFVRKQGLKDYRRSVILADLYDIVLTCRI